MLIQKDLKKIKEAKARLQARGMPGEHLALGWVLSEADISKKWWNSLRRYEVEHYGESRATDLSRP
jgi:hypothetical protein